MDRFVLYGWKFFGSFFQKRTSLSQRPTRDKLLDGAAAEITARGTLDISLADIAARAGVNSALVKYYFGSKTGLLVALARRDAARALVEMEQLLRKPIPAPEKMRLHLRGIMEAYRRSPYLNRLLHALLGGPDAEAAAEMQAHLVQPVMACQLRILEEGWRARDFREVDPLIFYLCVIGACDQFMQTETMLNLADRGIGLRQFQDRYIEHVVGMVLASLAPGPAGAEVLRG